MKKRLKLKPFAVTLIYMMVALSLVVSLFYMTRTLKESEEENLNYVSNVITEGEIPVVNLEKVIIRPFHEEGIETAKYFYDKDATTEKQENSIIYHEKMYLQNSGVDYKRSEEFEVVAVMDGTVIEVEDTELLGKSVKIRHDNELISVYQSLKDVTVNKGDTITQGQKIGMSGTSTLNSELNNHLHFEMYLQGRIIDPEMCYDKKLNELQ